MRKWIVLFVLLFPVFAFAKESEEHLIFNQTNTIREKKWVDKLIESDLLHNIALEECKYRSVHKMNVKLFMAHNRPWLTAEKRYESWFKWYVYEPIWWENQLYRSSKKTSATQLFYSSKSHRENLLDKDYVYMWVAVVGNFVCQSFAGK